MASAELTDRYHPILLPGDGGPADPPPLKEICFALTLLVLGASAIVVGIVATAAEIGGDKAHGGYFAALGTALFLPGFYYTRIAYWAWRGYDGFSYDSIPPV